jgi:hypothetical protein
MALPIGILGPLYGIARAVRLRVDPIRSAVMFAPALVMWLFVQWWARGGVSGALSDFTPGAIIHSVDVWQQPLFLPVAVYFLVTAAGGLSLIACCCPDAWVQLVRRSPEAIVLWAGVVFYAIVSGGAAPFAFGFLIPVWVLLCAEWSPSIGARRLWYWIATGLLLTLATQRPLARVDMTSYLSDWHPYDAYRSGAIDAAQLWAVWIPRFLFVGVVAWLVALIFGRPPREGDRRGGVSTAQLQDDRPRWRTPLAISWARVSLAVGPARKWTVLSYAYAVVLAGVTAYFLFGIPIQLTDSFANLLDIQAGSIWQVFVHQLHGSGYLRPMLHAQLKIVYELAGGNYFSWFRTVQALQVLAALLMSVRLLQPRHLTDLVVLPCALAMVLGLHTFAGTIREAFPINTFLTLVLCCLAAANLAQTRGGWLVDILAAALLTFSLLTLETGVLVWVIFVAGYLAGYRGVSVRGLVAATAVLGAYVALRTLYLHVGPPGLDERSTGFGFTVLEPSEVVARFGRNPLLLYLYNYASAILTVLFAEPRGGVWGLVANISNGTVETWDAINVITSTLTTGVLAWYIARRLPAWARRHVTEHDRLVMLFLAVLPVNALLCIVYVKDVIMSPAGVFYALAAAVAIRELLTEGARTIPRRVPVWTVVLLALISAGWGWRLLGIQYNLRAKAADVRAEWAYEDEWEVANHTQIQTPAAIALKRSLLDDAIWRRPAPPHLQMRWADHAFDTTQ